VTDKKQNNNHSPDALRSINLCCRASAHKETWMEIRNSPRLTFSAKAILKVLRDASPQPLTIIEMVARAGINYSTCSVQVRILELHGLARRVDTHRPIRYAALQASETAPAEKGER
jgi:hypothetical protein